MYSDDSNAADFKASSCLGNIKWNLDIQTLFVGFYSGSMNPGINAIMGPSGGGKTT